MPRRFHAAIVAGALLLGLGIFTPISALAATTLNSVRFKPVEDGTQVILDLSQIPADLKIQQSSKGQVSASFSGKLTPGFKSAVKRFSGTNLQQVYWESSKGKVQVFVKTAATEGATVYPLEKPNRLVFHIRNTYNKVFQAGEVAPGIKHVKLARGSKRGPLLINVLEVDPKNPFIEVIPALASNRMNSKARVETIVHKNNAIAGINGSFFKPDKGTPLGLLVIDGELLTGPIFERVALGISKNDELQMERVHLGGDIVLQNGSRFKVDNVNQPRTQASQTVVYSPRWGATAPPVPKNGIQIQLRNGQVMVSSTADPLPIPTDGYVISGPRNLALETLARQTASQPVQIRMYTTPDWSNIKHAIAGGPYLVKNGQIFIDTKSQHFSTSTLSNIAPRSAAGITREGKLLLVTVDGRQRGSVGVSLAEMASLMKQFGAINAMNLDGGSSTQMVVEGRLVNSPSVPNGVAVSNSLIIRKTQEARTPHDLEDAL